MHAPIDLSRYIQRRHFRAYERDMARGTYGYGVDLRRTRWLTTSMAGQAPLRALEHAWVPLAEALMGEELRFADRPGDIPLLSEIVEISRLLHTTPPALRILTPLAQRSGEWGYVTPLSDPRGSDEWLVLDLEALQRQSERGRAFLLGAGLGHLHCGHGALFAAHLVSHRRRRGHRLVRALLRPWVKVAAFSADRAGLLAASELPAALSALESADASTPAWCPSFPELALRRAALEEFAGTTVAARFRSRRAREVSASIEEDLRTIAGAAENEDENEPESQGTEAVNAGARQEVTGVPDDAWTLARCDHRLTRRLGLL